MKGLIDNLDFITYLPAPFIPLPEDRNANWYRDTVARV